MVHTDKMVFGLRQLSRPNVTFGVVFGKYVFLGQMGFLACVENYVLWVLCIGHASCILFEFYVFLSGGVWVLLTCGTIFGSVAFGAEFEEEEEEAEPEDAAPPGC